MLELNLFSKIILIFYRNYNKIFFKNKKMTQYVILTFILVTSFILGLILYPTAYFLASKSSNYEKVSPYECGFDPFSNIYQTFDVRYYLISILFIIFDLEISFLFPWSITFLYLGFSSYIFVLLFLTILTFGFIYEWVNNALDWV